MINRMLSVILLAVYASTSPADGNITQCVDEQGHFTFTDVFCVTTGVIKPGQGLGSVSLSSHGQSSEMVSRLTQPPNSPAISPTLLASVTDQALSQCNQKFNAFFRRKHPAITPIPAIEFNNIVDQFAKGTNISISLGGAVEYSTNDQLITASIECTVQKLHAQNDWLVGFQER